MAKKEDAKFKCSFCGRPQEEVKKLIAGPTVYICDECVGLCNEIIADEFKPELVGEAFPKLPTPKEIKKSLDEGAAVSSMAASVVSRCWFCCWSRPERSWPSA